MSDKKGERDSAESLVGTVDGVVTDWGVSPEYVDDPIAVLTIRLGELLGPVAFIGVLFATAVLIWINISDSLGVYLGILFLDIQLAAVGLIAWRAGRWIRERTQKFWIARIPPHDNISDEVSIDSFGAAADSFIPEISAEQVALDQRHKAIISVIIIQTLFALLIIAIGMGLFIILSDIPLTDWSNIKLEQNLSPIGALVSVLLGSGLGVISLGVLVVTSNAEQMLLIVLLVLLPSIATVPVARNFQRFSLNVHIKQYQTHRGITSIFLIAEAIISVLSIRIIFALFGLI
ncbi:hypothetical protein [Haloplanus rubicundus]|uniref:hypothetical protein n=1 Tax=Haloplanus rubicundus TaxID=1547898 RepID=UPI00130054DE|nr:hypothetical protein [Haloplanus rubicundus]